MMYTVTVGSITYYSLRKLDAIYKHVTFRYRDRARYKELTETQFKTIKRKNKVVAI